MGTPRTFSLEPLEERKLMTASVSSWSGSSITSPSGWNLYAEARFGDNGDTWGVGEVDVGTPSEEVATDTHAWDSNMANGLDSGWITVQLVVTTGESGSLEWTVGGTSFASESVGDLGAIRSVTVVADATGSHMAFGWQNLSVQFYEGTTLLDSATPSALSANTLASGSSAEAGATITTSYTSCDRMVVTGQIRLQALQDTTPSPSSIFGQVLISDQI